MRTNRFQLVFRQAAQLFLIVWRETIYDGTHSPLVSHDLFQRVQDVFSGHNKPKYRKHELAFAGLLRCAHDGCTVTTERQKRRYIYYRCSHGRGKCALPYMREQDVSNRLGEVLKGISVPAGVASQIVGSLRSDLDRSERERQKSLAALEQRSAAVRTRMDQIYDDKLDGKISEDFWDRKHGECQGQERSLQVQISRQSEPVTSEQVLTVQKSF